MKKLFFLLSLATLLLVLHSCKNNPCAYVVNYPKLDPRLPNYFYKVGSYWVYRDSANGTIDSQYVCYYLYRTHYRNPIDTPNKAYLPVSISGAPSSTYCGPYYLDDIRMKINSYLSGVFKDSFNFYAISQGDKSAALWEYSPPNSQTSAVTEFILEWSQTGILNCCYRLSPQGDTTGTWYRGTQPTISSGNYNFQNVYQWTVQIGDGTCPWFTYPTDLYLVPDSGIVKMVQHLPTGDVVWDLINYHIVT